ncbi:MAG TPA: FxsA family protein [Enhygromyxa sp.]|nr:FxsA family protein [Enhygromyxa sp.]
MLGRLFLLFTLIPLAEIYLLVKLGGLMGVWPTLALVFVTGALGASLARREGRRAIASYQAALAKGQLPEEGIVSGLLILVGGVLLIAPGVLTDVTGLALMIPPVRRAVAKRINARLQKRIADGSVQVMHLGAGGLGGFSGFDSRGAGQEGVVVDAEVVENRDAGGGPLAPRKR